MKAPAQQVFDGGLIVRGLNSAADHKGRIDLIGKHESACGIPCKQFLELAYELFTLLGLQIDMKSDEVLDTSAIRMRGSCLSVKRDDLWCAHDIHLVWTKRIS